MDKLNIRFVCQRVLSDFAELNRTQTECMLEWEKYKHAIEEITRISMSTDPNKKEKIKELREQAKDVNEFTKKFDGNAFHETRVKIIQRILRDNGYESSYPNEFFYDQMNPADIDKRRAHLLSGSTEVFHFFLCFYYRGVCLFLCFC